MKLGNDNYIVTNKTEDKTSSIKEYFPEFYELNKERIEEGKIIFVLEGWYVEGGFLLDTETKESFMVDLRM
ncbi:MAG: hypothetical protein SLAVMIC_00895 [uncultured marine phage]|uniref:Uncharacterized protein n=1 Tax=uncultured marine phage TaxID=707152 RepID=A0A8D9CEZ8_9VIRU|nr:MAG: hypothetical protein SLAVMIC_00895 [uncultured marine phage]